MAKISKDRATAYAQSVLSGEILAGPIVRAACQRHLNDLEYAGERGFYYDEKEAAEAIAFFEEILYLSAGQYEGEPFLLFPWEDFIIGSLFGWKRDDSEKWVEKNKRNKILKDTRFKRRFRVAYIEGPKGCGKSPLAGGIGLKGLCADKEARAEIYAAATKQAQAMVLFRDAVAMYEQSEILNRRLKSTGVGEKCWNLSHDESGSFFRVISSEKKGQSGPKPHMILLDEIHEHPDNTIIEMLRAGFKAREQPLSFMITNSGYDKTSVCWVYHEAGRKVAFELVDPPNDEFFAYICSLDDEDLIDDKYLDDESLWPKVNPSLEYGLPGYDYIRGQIAEARGMPSKMATVKRLSFCQWTEAENPWISPEIWIPCRDSDFDDSLLAGRKCWGGLDLSAVNDLTAFALMFAPSANDPMYRLKVWFWLPGENLRRKSEVDHVPYDVWEKQESLFTSEGSAISKTQVIRFIHNETAKYQLVGIAYDRNRMKDLIEFAEKDGIELAIGKWDKEKRVWNFDRSSGIKMMPFGQEARSMAPAIDKFETMLLQKQFRHDGNPCLTWCASNVVVDSDDSGYRKMSKKKSVGRIDGITASVMACGVLEDTHVKSVYEGMTEEQIIERISL